MLFPNPAKDYVILTNAKINTTIQIINSIGQVVFTQKINNSNPKINIQQLHKGIYAVKVLGETQSYKLVLE